MIHTAKNRPLDENFAKQSPNIAKPHSLDDNFATTRQKSRTHRENSPSVAGLRDLAHAGEEGPPEYILEAPDILKAERIDHGVRCLEDMTLVERLKVAQIPLTVCPLSNLQLQVFEQMSEHNIIELSHAGLRVTINSDDPAYFGGYINQNYAAVQQAFDLDQEALARYAAHSIEASFAPSKRKIVLLDEIARLIS